MASLLKTLCMFIWLHLASQASNPVVFSQPRAAAVGTLQINGSSPIGTTDDDFICATLDWWPPSKCDFNSCSWGNSSLLNLDLSNKYLLNAIKSFSHLKLRLGGTLQDRLVYQRIGDKEPCNQFVRNTSEFLGFTQGCLPMSRWDQLNDFFKLAGANIVFGLNALSGKVIGKDGNTTGAWNSSNAEYLMSYSVRKGYKIHGWELGNELSGKGIGARIPLDQYATDVIALQNLVQEVYNNSPTTNKPLVIGPGGFFDKDWFTKFVQKSNKSLQVATHHIYNLGPGGAPDLVAHILKPSTLDNVMQTFRDLQNIMNSTGGSTVAWVGEAGGAYRGGQNNVTNAFVFSFWYLDQLGMSSTFDTKAYCRQSLIGGNYGLLDTQSYLPNPDYFSALLWDRLMGRNVLSASFNGSKNIRAYAHCSKNTEGVTLLLINLDNITSFQVDLWIEKSGIYDNKDKKMMRDEYHLTPKDGKLNSRTMLLNGKELSVNSTGIIPALEPKTVHASEPITVAPWSILFAHVPSIRVQACN